LPRIAKFTDAAQIAVRGRRRQLRRVIRSVTALIRGQPGPASGQASPAWGASGAGLSRRCGWRQVADITVRSPGGNLGPGASGNDDALDPPATLTRQDAASRRDTLERIFRATREHPQDLNWTPGPGQVVAAAAVVAAGLPTGEAFLQEITGRDDDVAALMIPGNDPELAGAALAALLIAAGRDGAWHLGWVDAGTALQARGTTDPFASVFYRHQHRNDQELSLQP
jgi:hypothetical protein